jgi:hypothetical protein
MAGCPDNAIADQLDPTDRERLVARMRELAELEQLAREVSKQSPPDTPQRSPRGRRASLPRGSSPNG